MEIEDGCVNGWGKVASGRLLRELFSDFVCVPSVPNPLLVTKFTLGVILSNLFFHKV